MTHRPARQRATLLVLCIAAALGAAACSSGASTASSQSSQSAGPSQSAEVRMSGGYVMNEDGTLQQPETNASVPKLNAAALQFTPEAAELAARHFLALTEYAWATGDTHPMKDFSSEECEACLSMVEAIDSLYSSGGWSNGLHYELRKMIRSEEAPDLESTMVVEMLIENSTRDVFEHHTLEKRASSLSKMTLLLGWDGSTWKATGVGATAA